MLTDPELREQFARKAVQVWARRGKADVNSGYLPQPTPASQEPAETPRASGSADAGRGVSAHREPEKSWNEKVEWLVQRAQLVD